MKYSRSMTVEAAEVANELIERHIGKNVDILRGMIDGVPAHVQAQELGVAVTKIYDARRRWTQVLGAWVDTVWGVREKKEKRPEGSLSNGEMAEILDVGIPALRRMISDAPNVGLPVPGRVNSRFVWTAEDVKAWVKYFGGTDV